MSKFVSALEVAKHDSANDLWIVVEGKVYDMTEFAPQHPGGAAIILRHAGRDATAAYSEVHSLSTIEDGLPVSKKLGLCDTSSTPPSWISPTSAPSRTASNKPPLDTLINTHDFVHAASISISTKAYAFYSSAATDTLTKAANNSAYNSMTLRPRVMRNVATCDASTTMLGYDLRVPIFCAPASMAKMIHPQGEMELARGCAAAGIAQCISTSASFTAKDIFSAVAVPGGETGQTSMPLFFQLYVDKQRWKSEKLLAEVEKLGSKAIFVTVDAAIAGKREADERVKADEGTTAPMSGIRAKNDAKGGALGRIMAGFIDPALCWDDLPWLRKHTSLPIVLKGIMTADDAKRAMELGVDGIVLSNHGGRNLDTSPAPVMVLLEIQRRCPEVLDAMEVYVDGGIMRGTDIFKALCLGAKAVGIGRGMLFALNYGQEGVTKYIEILKDELEVTMRLCGITDLSQVHPGLVNTAALDPLVPAEKEHPYAKWRPKPKI